jgi:pimeloyl-ACP methyl ester carboxylesterase
LARTRRVRGAQVEDASLDVEGGDPVEAFVVSPGDGSRPKAGVLWLHWLGEHHNDRTQLMPEAIDLARAGVRSVLPAGRLPWLTPPTDAATDVASIELEGRRLDRAFAELAQPLGAKAPVAMVGHDFGAMHGLLLAARQPRIASAVCIAGVPRWADWFLPFWPIAGGAIDYRRALEPFDPVGAVSKTKAELLFQFSRRDFYIAPMTARELARAARRDVGLEWYEADHAMRSPKARASRRAFLERHLLDAPVPG